MLYDLLSLSDAIPERHVPPEAALQVRLVLDWSRSFRRDIVPHSLVLVATFGGLCL